MSPSKGLQASMHAGPPSTTATTTATSTKTKAYYRVVRLDQREIQRRSVAGHCTYCNETGHARRSCAAGRLMRKVPKRVLDTRLRSGVCPLCGDAAADGHCKATCPQKQALQASLDARGSEEKDTEREREFRRCSRVLRRRVPLLPSLQLPCASTAAGSAEDDLIDMCDAGTTTGSSSGSSGSPDSMSDGETDTDTDGTLCPSTPPLTASTASACGALSMPLKPPTQSQSLLDAAATEMVWGDVVTLPVAKRELELELGGDEGMRDMGEQAYANLAEDLIEF